MLFVIYLMQSVVHIFLCYKILKAKKVISGLVDFLINANSGYSLLLQIFLGRKQSSSFIEKLFRVNIFVAINILIFMVLMIILC